MSDGQGGKPPPAAGTNAVNGDNTTPAASTHPSTDTSHLTGAAPPAARVNSSNPASMRRGSALPASQAAGRMPNARSPSVSSMSGPSSSAIPGMGRPTISMIPRGGVPGTRGGGPPAGGGGSGGVGGPAGSTGPRMVWKPVLPQRRKPSAESTTPSIKQEPGTSTPGTSSPGRGGRGGRGGSGAARGGRGGGRTPVEMVASGPFAMGTGSLSRYERKRLGGGGSGPSTSSAGKWDSGSNQVKTEDKLKPKADPDGRRSNYRNPDRLRDREEYSDQESDIEIVDMGDVADLDALAPRSLPRVQEKEKKKKKDSKEGVKVKKSEAPEIKPDPEDEEASEAARLAGQNGAQPAAAAAAVAKKREDEISEDDSDSDDVRETGGGVTGDGGEVRAADALDLSESEEEEMMDDLVDDFVFDEWENEAAEDAAGADPTRLYLFQFPQEFPKFTPAANRNAAAPANTTAPKTETSTAGPSSALSSSPPGGSKPRRSVAFADAEKPPAASSGVKREAGMDARMSELKIKSEGGADGSEGGSRGPEGLVGRLQVYKDGRVEMHFDRGLDAKTGQPRAPLIMEVAGGSQPTFLQDLAILDSESRKATILGEVHRKFTVSPSVDGMLADAARFEDRTMRMKQRQSEGSGVGAAGGASADDEYYHDSSSSDEDEADRAATKALPRMSRLSK